MSSEDAAQQEPKSRALTVAQTENRDPDELVATVAAHLDISRDYLPRLFANDETLTALDLANTNCGDVPVTALADALRGNDKVVSLDLSSNEITADGALFLSEALEVNKTLRSIRLDNNAIGDAGIYAIAKAMEVNDTIEEVTIEGNAVETDEVATQLLLTNTKLNTHPPRLKAAILALRRDEAEGLVDLSRFDEAAAEYRDLQHNKRAHIDDWGTGVLADQLAENQAVTELNLSHQHIGNDGARRLADALVTNRVLDRIDLTGNMITAEGAQFLIDSLRENNSLRYLVLHGNPLSNEVIVNAEQAVTLNRQPLSLKACYHRLMVNDGSLVTVELDDHRSQRYFDDISARLIADALIKNTYLLSLSITNSKISLVGARFLSDALAISSTLQALDLSNNPIKDGTTHLAKALVANHTLLSLRLAGTEMPDASAKEIATILHDNDTLSDVDISNNPDVCDAGQAFVEAFNYNITLRTLDLDGTSIPEKVLRVIDERRKLAQEPKKFRLVLQRMIEQNPTLTTAGLSGEGQDQLLRDASMNILAAAIRENFVVVHLDVSHNNIKFDGFAALCDALLENSVTLESLNISHNPIGSGYELGKTMASVLRVHRRLKKVNLSATGLDTDGCQELVYLVDTDKINVVRSITIDENPAVSKQMAFKLWLLVECNSLLSTFKRRVLDFWRQWEENDARAYYEYRLADFTDFDRNDAPPSTPSHIFQRCAFLVCEMLRRTKGYQILRYASNRLTDIGAEYFTELLAEDHGITTVDFSNNTLTDDTMDPLLNGVRRGYDIVDVDVSGNRYIAKEKIETLNILLLYNKQPRPIKELLVKVNVNDPSFNKVDFSNQLTDHLQDHHVRLICDALKTNTNLVSIDLSNNHIHLEGFKLLVETVEKHPGLQRFVLKNTLVRGKEVGPLIARLINCEAPLTYIDLSYNDFSDDILEPIEEAIRGNNRIKFLGLAECGLNNLSYANITNTVSLNSRHALRDLMPLLRANDPTITKVDAARGGYLDAHAIEVVQCLINNTTVEDVSFEGNALSDYAGKEIMVRLADNHGLKHLNLARNKLTGATIPAVEEMVRRNKTLQTINLAGNEIDEESLMSLKAAVLEGSESLAKIILVDEPPNPKVPERFTPETLEFFHETLTLNLQHTIKRAYPKLEKNDFDLYSLEARDNGQHNDVGCWYLSRSLVHNTHLRELVLSGGKVTYVGVQHLCKGLRVNRTLRQLSLSDNLLCDKALFALGELLLVNTGINDLSIAGHADFTDVGARELHRVLRMNDTLEKLDMKRCPNLSAEVVDDIEFFMMLNNRNIGIKSMLRDQEDIIISELDFSNSERRGKVLDDEACRVIVKALKGNKFVQKLNLSNNQLTFESGYALKELLLNNDRLTDIDLSSNGINEGGLSLVEALHTNGSVTVLNLESNGCSPSAMEKLRMCLMLNREPPAMKQEALKLLERDISHVTIRINTPEFELGSILHRKPQLDDDSVGLVTEILRADMIVNEVNLAWNAIKDPGLMSMADLIRINNRITSINFGHNFISDDGLLRLCDAAAMQPSLQFVNLQFNQITSEVLPIVKHLLENHGSVHQFSLEGNKIDRRDVDMVNFLAEANANSHGDMRTMLIAAGKNDPEVEELNFVSAAALGNWSLKSTKLVGFALRNNTHITKALLEFNDITDEELPPLGEMLRHNKTLTSLSLAENKICDIGRFCEDLRRNTTLKVLDLRRNHMDKEASVELAGYLREHDGIEELDISHNKWGRLGATIVTGALPMNDSVTTINVEGDGISIDLCELAKYNTTLHYKHVKLLDAAEEAAPPPPTQTVVWAGV